MIKYVPETVSVVMEEIPDRVTLAVDISNCPGNCRGCHSPFLREDVGLPLTPAVIDRLLADNFGVNCFLFLGEGRDPESLLSLAAHVRSHGVAPALYSGREAVEEAFWAAFDYVKLGPYIPERGPLNNRDTNQRLYQALPEGKDAPASASVVPSVVPSAVPHSVPLVVPHAGRHSVSLVVPHAGRRFADITARFWHRGIDPLV